MYLIALVVTVYLFWCIGTHQNLAEQALNTEGGTSGVVYHIGVMITQAVTIVGMLTMVAVQELIKLNEKESKPLEQRQGGINS